MALVHVVENQASQLALICLNLENEGHHVVTSTCGGDVLALAKSQRPDLILLDMMLPDIGGLDVLSQLKRDMDLKETPIIMVSGRDSSDDITAALDIGAHDYVTKPLNLSILNARVRTALRLSDGQKALREANHKLAQLASYDSLTGLYNRRIFMDRLEEEISKANRFNRKLSLIMLDVDHFKKVNDTYGHPVGDKVLCQLANIIMKTMRQTDIACRVGGEEFAIICTETDLDGALLLAERLRIMFMEDSVGQQQIHYSASFGVTTLAKETTDPSVLIGVTDQYLYQAKMTGRNRICHSAAQ